MKGYRTLILNGLGVVGSAGLTWAVGVDWTQYVSPQVAMPLVFALNMALRFITNSPVGKS